MDSPEPRHEEQQAQELDKNPILYNRMVMNNFYKLLLFKRLIRFGDLKEKRILFSFYQYCIRRIHYRDIIIQIL